MAKHLILIIAATSALGLFTARPANAQRAFPRQSISLVTPTVGPRESRTVIANEEANVALLSVVLDNASSAYATARTATRLQLENTPELKEAQQAVLNCAAAVARAREPVTARVAADPAYRQLIAQEAAARKRADALRDAKASADQISAAAREALGIGGLASAMHRAAEQADAPLLAATQNLAEANRALSNAREQAAADLAADPKLAGLKKAQDDAAAAVTTARKRLIVDSSPATHIPGGRTSRKGASERVAATPPSDPEYAPKTVKDQAAMAQARAEIENAKTSYAVTIADSRREFEQSPEFQDAQKDVADATSAVAAARKVIQAKLAADPAYKQLRDAEAAAQKKVDALRKAYAAQDQILAAAKEVLHTGGLTSAMERRAQQADESLAKATQTLLAANRVLAKMKAGAEADLAADPQLATFKKAQETAAAALADASIQLEKDSPHPRSPTLMLPPPVARGLLPTAPASSVPQPLFNVPAPGPR